MNRSARHVLLACCLALVPACSSNGGTGNDDDDPTLELLAGVYDLKTIDGQPLPFILEQEGDDMVEVIKGTVILQLTGTFSDITEFRITVGGEVSTASEEAAGTWTLSGSTVVFNPTTSSSYSMAWDGASTLTQVFEGLTIVYMK